VRNFFLFVGRSAQGRKIVNVIDRLGYANQIQVEVLSTLAFLNADRTDLEKYRAIFVVNKDSDHEKTIRFLADSKYSGYVFLEKPIFLSREFLKFLENFDATKTYVNLPSKFTTLYKILESRFEDPTFGKLLHSRLELSYGIFHKKELRGNWRFESETNPSGVLSTLGIHYVHMLRILIGEIEQSHICSAVSSQDSNSSSVLTGEISMRFKESIASILLSYESPYQFCMKLVFSNALLEISDSSVTVFYPRDNFDENGLFIKPPIVEVIEIETLDWEKATEGSISYFIDTVLSKGAFPRSDWEIAKEVNEIVCLENA